MCSGGAGGSFLYQQGWSGTLGWAARDLSLSCTGAREMKNRLSLFGGLAAVALLMLASTTEAAPRYKRLGLKVAPPSKRLPGEVEKAVKRVFPAPARITGWTLEEKNELEVFVSFPGSPMIEVVFLKKGTHWRLAGYEYPVPAASLTPKAHAALLKKYPKGKIAEVELVFDAAWKFLGYQVLIAGKEVFITAGGVITKDPL
jgi:hypothetical protein